MSESLGATYAFLTDGWVASAPQCPACGAASVRVGTDVQAVAEVADAVERHGERYLGRLFTLEEVADCRRGATGWTPEALASLAARYAAKESVAKVLRSEVQVPWTDVRVRREPEGWCDLELTGRAQQLAEDAGIRRWALSIAHDGGLAVATVIGAHDCGPGTVPRPTPRQEHHHG